MRLSHAVGPARLALALLILSAAPGFLVAADVTLAWDRNPEPDIAGYKLYYGTSSRSYTHVIDVGNLLQQRVTGLPAGAYFFAVTAYNSSGLESGFSNEVPALLSDGGTGSRCDINADGTPNVLDLQILVNAVLGIVTRTAAHDLNSDGTVDVIDLQILVNVVLGLGSCP